MKNRIRQMDEDEKEEFNEYHRDYEQNKYNNMDKE